MLLARASDWAAIAAPAGSRTRRHHIEARCRNRSTPSPWMDTTASAFALLPIAARLFTHGPTPSSLSLVMITVTPWASSRDLQVVGDAPGELVLGVASVGLRCRWCCRAWFRRNPASTSALMVPGLAPFAPLWPGSMTTDLAATIGAGAGAAGSCAGRTSAGSSICGGSGPAPARPRVPAARLSGRWLRRRATARFGRRSRGRAGHRGTQARHGDRRAGCAEGELTAVGELLGGSAWVEAGAQAAMTSRGRARQWRQRRQTACGHSSVTTVPSAGDCPGTFAAWVGMPGRLGGAGPSVSRTTVERTTRVAIDPLP